MSESDRVQNPTYLNSLFKNGKKLVKYYSTLLYQVNFRGLKFKTLYNVSKRKKTSVFLVKFQLTKYRTEILLYCLVIKYSLLKSLPRHKMLSSCAETRVNIKNIIKKDTFVI